MFDKNNPARNIYELVTYLEANKNEKHFFRGQIHRYDVNSPSLDRRSITGETKDVYWNLMRRNNLVQTDQDLAKAKLQHSVLNIFGKAVGNILCQQYGITSDAYDITKDIIVGAFFATRKYPNYEPYIPKVKNECGVIYRININPSQPSPENIEMNIGALKYLKEDLPPLYFTNIKYIIPLLLNGSLSNDSGIENYINTHIPYKKTKLELVRSTIYLTSDTIKKLVIHRFEEIGFSGDLEEMFNRSRIGMQSAGILFPSFLHDAIIPSQAYPKAIIGQKTVQANPNIAVSLGVTAVFELNYNYNVECFYFEHDSDCQVEIDDNSILWPDRKEDHILKTMIELAEEICKDYLNNHKVDAMNPKFGIIDPGYYS